MIIQIHFVIVYLFTVFVHVAAEASDDSCRTPPPADESASLLQKNPGSNQGEKKMRQQISVEEVALNQTDPFPDWRNHGLHKVVGEDGVLMISLASEPQRFESSSAKLKEAGIHPTLFPGTDGRDWNVSQKYLDQAIAWPDKAEVYKPGSKHARAVQALADSHRLALLAAQKRNYTWTAILEDDAIPMDGPYALANWPFAFEKIWEKLPLVARYVRLGYCNPSRRGNYLVNTFIEGEPFRITNWLGYTIPDKNGWYGYMPGMCTTAYMVHKEVIPELLKIFPCSGQIDGCYLGWFGHPNKGDSEAKGHKILYNIDTNKPVAKAYEDAKHGNFGQGVGQFGVLMQDWTDLPNGTTNKLFSEPNEDRPNDTETVVRLSHRPELFHIDSSMPA